MLSLGPFPKLYSFALFGWLTLFKGPGDILTTMFQDTVRRRVDARRINLIRRKHFLESKFVERSDGSQIFTKRKIESQWNKKSR